MEQNTNKVTENTEQDKAVSLSTAQTDKNENVQYPISGFESIQGRRMNMEDAHVCYDDVSSIAEHKPGASKRSFYGVYDGHGGPEAAIEVEKILHKSIVSDPKFSTSNGNEMIEILRNGFLNADKQILEIASAQNFTSGSTVVVVVLAENTLSLGNVGDSEAVLAKRTNTGYEAILLSQKQKPSDASEKDRIKKAGGHVVFGRVMGTLAVSRAIGDRDFKYPFNKAEGDFVSAEPFTNQLTLQPENEFLILACDGLWDKLSYQEAVDYIAVQRHLGISPTEAAKNIVKYSYDRGSLDNITTIVVYLTPHPKIDDFPTKIKSKNIASLFGLVPPEPPAEPTRVLKMIQNNTNKSNSKPEDEDEEVDFYEFLRQEAEKKLARASVASPKGKKYFAMFKLPQNETVQQEHACGFEQTLIYNGVLLITQNYLCFYSNAFSKRIQKQIPIVEIESIRKHKSLVVMNAITIETNTGKKYTFNWKQNQAGRDTAFKRIVESVNNQQEGPDTSSKGNTSSTSKKSLVGSQPNNHRESQEIIHVKPQENKSNTTEPTKNASESDSSARERGKSKMLIVATADADATTESPNTTGFIVIQQDVNADTPLDQDDIDDDDVEANVVNAHTN